ncbi:SMI1/KNR4 family protein [Actinocatenispora rupis]|uniref:Knr4/Smi1-like domain-containing protein n=1 Tax=Actinocatenispora rupis TaxID=519421 RepID=A0A8J3N9X0_9ACTN|nr:SMI1/KNR4 family protein [Actinocatenispora rupis]GID11496.1 hypothetical protein Aru02nite_23850 [Actinocatenispora rupis]
MARSVWTGTRERLARLASTPGAGAVFGSAGHGWMLQPPLPADELAEAETQLRVEFPAGYRSFLTEVGSGGAGPAYGLFPLRTVGGRWQWDGDGADLTGLSTLDRPFPHVEAFNPADGLPAPPQPGQYVTTAEFNAAEDAYWERYDAVVLDPAHSTGLLYLCHLGCARREALVVSGPARGQMWADDIAGGGGFRPLGDDDGAPLDFARWYLRWLELAEDQVTGSVDG